MSQHAIELDFAVEVSTELELHEAAAAWLASVLTDEGVGVPDVTVGLVDLEGPGGGWPLVSFVGPLSQLKLLANHYANNTTDSAEVNELISWIVDLDEKR